MEALKVRPDKWVMVRDRWEWKRIITMAVHYRLDPRIVHHCNKDAVLIGSTLYYHPFHINVDHFEIVLAERERIRKADQYARESSICRR